MNRLDNVSLDVVDIAKTEADYESLDGRSKLSAWRDGSTFVTFTDIRTDDGIDISGISVDINPEDEDIVRMDQNLGTLSRAETGSFMAAMRDALFSAHREGRM